MLRNCSSALRLLDGMPGSYCREPPARLPHLLSGIHLDISNILEVQVVLRFQAASGSFVELGRSYRRHGPGLAVHVQRNLQSKQIEQCWSNICDGVSVARDLPVGKEHAGNETGIYAVISAPGFGIELEDCRRYLTLCGIPRRSVALSESDDDVGRVLPIRSGVGLHGVIGSPNGDS